MKKAHIMLIVLTFVAMGVGIVSGVLFGDNIRTPQNPELAAKMAVLQQKEWEAYQITAEKWRQELIRLREEGDVARGALIEYANGAYAYVIKVQKDIVTPAETFPKMGIVWFVIGYGEGEKEIVPEWLMERDLYHIKYIVRRNDPGYAEKVRWAFNKRK